MSVLLKIWVGIYMGMMVILGITVIGLGFYLNLWLGIGIICVFLFIFPGLFLVTKERG